MLQRNLRCRKQGLGPWGFTKVIMSSLRPVVTLPGLFRCSHLPVPQVTLFGEEVNETHLLTDNRSGIL